MVLALGIVAAPSGAQSGPAESSSQKSWKAAREALEKHRRWYLPPAFEDERLVSWAKAHGLNEPAVAMLTAMGVNYRNTVAQMNRTTGAKLVEAWAGAFRYDPVEKEAVVRPGGEALTVLEERTVVIQTYAEAERTLFSAAEGVATPESRESLRHLRHVRMKELYDLPTSLPGTDVDLPQALRDLRIDLASNPQWLEMAESFLKKRDDLMRERHGLMCELELARVSLLVDAGHEWNVAATPELRARVQQDLADIERAELATELPLRRLLRGSLEGFLRGMNADDARRVRLEILNLTHPTVFDDEREFGDLVKSLAAATGVTPEAGKSMLATLANADRRLSGLALKQVDATDRYFSLLYEVPDEVIGRLQTEGEILKIQADRRKIIQETAGNIDSLLGADEGGNRHNLDDYLVNLESLAREGADRRAAINIRIQELQDALAAAAAAAAAATEPEPAPQPAPAPTPAPAPPDATQPAPSTPPSTPESPSQK
jgi:hypothetical protein